MSLQGAYLKYIAISDDYLLRIYFAAMLFSGIKQSAADDNSLIRKLIVMLTEKFT